MAPVADQEARETSPAAPESAAIDDAPDNHLEHSLNNAWI
jgi:hypothetical protein